MKNISKEDIINRLQSEKDSISKIEVCENNKLDVGKIIMICGAKAYKIFDIEESDSKKVPTNLELLDMIEKLQNEVAGLEKKLKEVKDNVENLKHAGKLD